MGQIMGYTLGTWAWPVGALIVIAILAVFGYAMYRWKKQEPKAPSAENGADAGGTSGGGVGEGEQRCKVD